ncbi:hypothetical protein BU26DRAFT_300494 [Trematosphaeria pertusa]|uniref:Uncharacterized protein n=1 Tax=Trematosphaeria pertusa TaxID=390896 RepID=A0A6A6ILK8_9PLEO|nr:uncharacterized protein BU26DRAFT_300494 [Trematosphaeria pertusa]KAF2250363.1 hypothetical protein BU26DRAFT_300494 [Trematosphaeria pertusa]
MGNTKNTRASVKAAQGTQSPFHLPLMSVADIGIAGSAPLTANVDVMSNTVAKKTLSLKDRKAAEKAKKKEKQEAAARKNKESKKLVKAVAANMVPVEVPQNKLAAPAEVDTPAIGTVQKTVLGAVLKVIGVEDAAPNQEPTLPTNVGTFSPDPSILPRVAHSHQYAPLLPPQCPERLPLI